MCRNRLRRKSSLVPATPNPAVNRTLRIKPRKAPSLSRSTLSIGNSMTIFRSILACLLIFLSACATTSNSTSNNQLLELSQQALTAYSNGDYRNWERLVCGRDAAGKQLVNLDDLRKILGEVSVLATINVRGDTKTMPMVAYKISASNHPAKEAVLKFFLSDQPNCVGLLY